MGEHRGGESVEATPVGSIGSGDLEALFAEPLIWEITLGHLFIIGLGIGLVVYWFTQQMAREVEKLDESYDEKQLDEIVKPDLKAIIQRYGQPVFRMARHGRTNLGMVDRSYVFNLRVSDVNSDVAACPSPEDHPRCSVNSEGATIKCEDDEIEVEAMLMRPDSLFYRLLDLFYGIPDRYLTVEIWPTKHIKDRDYIELDRNINVTRIGGVFLADTDETKHLVMNSVWKETAESMMEGVPNFLKRLTHYDVSQAKKTQMEEKRNELEIRKWSGRDQRDVERM